ncbi:DUF4252 domain-containing protein [Prevotella brunnea]|uniref:DUF4252 domain-containing protein n=1 Tax=Prevotella brunnea TaxID=2508867 RepID=A0A5C8GJG1_9BACT|nr:DUF4252 domain-containing protein [Prevotella brunnea]TXJ62118.1 DUF4252 domain-containing protein [Prevotella brunnea]
MKRIWLLLLLGTFSCLTFAQKALFDKYEDMNGVTTVYISTAMLRMIKNVPTSNKDISKISGKLDHLQVLECARPTLIPEIKKTAINYFRKMRYTLVMQVRDGGEHVTIYEKRYKNGKNEFVLLTTEKDDLSIINVFGNVTLQDIQSITAGK